MKSWWVGLDCRWCRRRVTQSGEAAAFHYPHDGEPWAEHCACREENGKR